MPLIKPRTRGKQFVRHITRLDRENHETLYAYAHFLGESAEYVLNQLVEAKLAKDKEFVAWRVEHPESFVPPPGTPHPARRRAGSASLRGAAGHGPSARPVLGAVGGARMVRRIVEARRRLWSSRSAWACGVSTVLPCRRTTCFALIAGETGRVSRIAHGACGALVHYAVRRVLLTSVMAIVTSRFPAARHLRPLPPQFATGNPRDANAGAR